MQYSKLVEVYEQLEATSKRLEKTFIISALLKQVPESEVQHIVLLLQGKVFPVWDESKIGVAARLILKAISVATGIKADEVEKEWKKTGDLGETAKELISKKRQQTLFSHPLSVKKVFDNLQKLPSIEGMGSVEKKIGLIAELLTSSKPVEAKYIVRTVLEELRVGVASGTLRDSILWAYFEKQAGFTYNEKEKSIDVKDRKTFNHYVDIVQNAFDVTNDFSEVAKAAAKGENSISSMEIVVGKPIKVMLAIKAKDIKDAFERVGKPAQAEYKYDGFRIIAHKTEKEIILFTRRLENVTKQFPELVKYIKENVKAKTFIIDSEAVGFNPKTKKYLPFQSVSQRIRRKYEIEEMSKKFPVELNVFDLIAYNGKNLLNEPFKERRKILEKIVKPKEKKIILAKKIISSDEKEVEKFYHDSISAGNEGLMMKKLDAPYKPGARVGHMVKIKSEQKEIDVVIIGAEWGEGKRARWLSSFLIACIDENGEYVSVGKVGTGIKEKFEEGVSFHELTELLRPLITSEKGRIVVVRPKIVVEVTYEEIQKSPTYSSGFALRFPRVKRLRHMERRHDDILKLDELRDLYDSQKKT